MAVPRTTLWEIQPHTRAKHRILKSYLDAWLPIMARYNGRILFIDGFAGPGRYSGGEEGSPLIALRALLDHPHFVRRERGTEVVFFFIENYKRRAAALREEIAALKSERPLPAWVLYEVIEGKFAPNLNRMLDSLKVQHVSIAPTFAFVDPFGFGDVPMEAMARLVRNHHCEFLINFSFDSINRFLTHPDPKIQEQFDRLFGTSGWRGILELKDPEARREKILELYAQMLKKVAKLKYVRRFEMMNEGNRMEYVLFFGTNSEQGLSKMKQAMWRADPEAGQIFSDRSDPRQMVLLQTGAEAGLTEVLRKRFKGSGFVPIEAAELFVLVETPYSEKIHLKRKTLARMEKASPTQLDVRRPNGARDRAGEYPSGTMMKFI